MTRIALTSLLWLFIFIGSSNAQVFYSCSFAITDVNFGSVDTLAGGAVDTSAEITGTCDSRTLLADVRVRICPGLNRGSGNATSGVRQLRNAANQTLSYNFYQDPARTIPWGSAGQPALGGVPSIDILIPAQGSTSFSRTLYARILGGQQAVSPGAYTSVFSAAETQFTHDDYVAFPHNCNTHTQFRTTTPTFTVQANVIPNCLVTAQNINFGTTGVLDTAIDATGGLGVTCTPGTTYNVALNNGLTGTGPTARRMTLGGQAVVYGLYKDSTRNQPWGDSGAQRLPGTGTGTTQAVPVYGRVPAQQTPAPGTYTDTVVVTVTY